MVIGPDYGIVIQVLDRCPMRLLIAASAKSTNTLSLVESLAACGNDVHIATLHSGAVPSACVHQLGSAASGISRAAFLAAVPAFRRLHRHLAPAVTIGYYASSYGLLAACVPGPRVVATAGGDILREAEDSPIRRLLIPLLARLALSRADLILCWAPHLASAAQALGAKRELILTLPRGIDTDLFHEPASLHDGPPSIISTRKLDSFYRPGVLLEAFAKARSTGLVAGLVLVGDGPAESQLRERTMRLGLGDVVTFSGRLTPVELAHKLRASSVYASLPRSEGVSASLLEAMASGLVPVVNDLPANLDWIRHGANGLTVPEPPAIDAVAAALCRAVTDQDLARRARQVNPAHVRLRASRAVNAREFNRAFENLVRARHRAA